MKFSWQRLRLQALWVWHQLLTLGLGLLVLMAVWVGLGRQFVPLVSDYKASIEARLSVSAGVPVRLEGISGRWEGLGPVFVLQGLRVHDPARPTGPALLRLPVIEVRPAVWQSLSRFEPRLDVRLRGLDVHLDQLDDGRLQLRELAALRQSDPAAARRVLELVLRQPLLSVEDSRIGLALHGRPALVLTHVSLLNRNEGRRHQLAGSVVLPAVAEPLALRLELLGSPLDWRQGALDVWLKLPALVLDEWLPAGAAGGVKLASVTGGGEFWLHFVQGQLQSLQAQPRLRTAALNTSAHGDILLRALSGEASWQRQPTGWTLSLQGLQAKVDETAWPVPALTLVQQSDRLALTLAAADVAGAARLAGRLPLPPALGNWLLQAAPQGRIEALGLQLERRDDDHWAPTALALRASRLGLAATAQWPGARGLSGWLHWRPDTAVLGLDSTQAVVDLPQVFREPVAVERLAGVLRLDRDASGWTLRSGPLSVRNADATGQAVLALELPAGRPAEARLSLLARLQNARAASTWRYVPWGPAGDHTLDWLRAAIVGGTVTRGDFLYAGPLHDQPGGERHRMLMQFALRNGELDYQPGWPALRQLDAEVTIDGSSLAITGQQALLYDGTRATALVASIPDLKNARLQVAGQVSSTGPDLLRLLSESPLKTHTAGVASALSLNGPLQGRLALDIPLSPRLNAETEVTVAASLHDNQLTVRREGLEVSGLRGEVRYTTAQGLTAPVLQAVMLGAPVKAQLGSEMRRGELLAVNVGLAGRASVPALRDWLGASPLWEAVQGEAAYQARIRLPAGSEPAELNLLSGLEGLRIQLPAPFAKTAAEVLPLRYQSALGSGEQMARLQLGRRLAAGLVWQDGRLRRGRLRLGSGDAPAAPEADGGLQVEGQLTRLEVAEWQPWIDKVISSPSTPVKGATSALPSLQRLELDSKELLVRGWRFADATLGLYQEPGQWRLTLTTPELEGAATLPLTEGRDMQVNLARLRWPLAGAPGASVSSVGQSAASHAATQAATNVETGWSGRAVQFGIENLQLIGRAGVGPLSVQGRLLPQPTGLRVDGLQVQAAAARFDGRLDWQWRGASSTRLQGVAHSNNVGALLQGLGYAPSLQSPSARADFSLGWPGGPEAFALAGLDGRLDLRVEDGRLLNVNAATSASRVFGLIDLDNIRRRLKGDFSDVLQRGLSFDAVTLAGEVESGVMPAASFLLRGPSLSAAGLGRLDLARQQLDQEFAVSVPVSSAVPLAAAVVGGPLVGGAVAAAEVAFRKQLDKATLLHYRITGSWSDPVVDRHNRKQPALDAVLNKAMSTREKTGARP
ncbi:MAG: YhdP family protein [Moraxellaceae bacterium]|nr:YhdP family protein [Moraxellaceae bacterium]